MTKHFYLFILGFCAIFCFGQRYDYKTDTIYYPFYEDVQMIEVEHIQMVDSLKNENISSTYLKISPQRAQNLSEYFFRNRKGEIVKVYNSTWEKGELSKYFKSKPQLGSKKLITHKMRESQKKNYTQYNYHYIISSFVDKSSSNDFVKEKALPQYGLIDSLGNIKVKARYEWFVPVKNAVLTRQRNLYGIIDFDEKVILPFEYTSYLGDYKMIGNQDYIVFCNGLNFIQNKPNPKIAAVYHQISQTIKPLKNYHTIDYHKDKQIIPVTKFGKLGFLDLAYNEILAPQYEMVDFDWSQSGIYRVAVNGKYGFIDQNGKMVIDLQFDYATPFNQDSIALTLKNGKFYCINSKGKKIKHCDLSPDWSVSKDNILNEFQLLINQVNNTNALYNKVKNEFVIPFQIDAIFESSVLGKTSSEFYQFRDLETNKIGIINLRTGIKSDIIYDYVAKTFDNRLIVRKDNFDGLLDQNFNTIIDFKYLGLRFSQVNPDHLYFRNEQHQVGMMDLKEHVIIKPSDIYLHSNPNYTKTQKDELFGILDKNGNTLISPMYDEIEDFGSNELLIVRKNRKYGVVNYQNEIILPIDFSLIYPAQHKASKSGYITAYKQVIKNGYSTSETVEIKID